MPAGHTCDESVPLCAPARIARGCACRVRVATRGARGVRTAVAGYTASRHSETRPADRRSRAVVHAAGSTRTAANAGVAARREGDDAGLLPLRGLVTVLQDAARRAARPAGRADAAGDHRGGD